MDMSTRAATSLHGATLKQKTTKILVAAHSGCDKGLRQPKGPCALRIGFLTTIPGHSQWEPAGGGSAVAEVIEEDGQGCKTSWKW
eukprot:1149362-Pelagomonas_calceolata.AAC.2